MATFFKFEQFIEDLAHGVHDLETDTLKVYLSNAAPSASADAVKTDLAEITNQNGYTAPVTVTVSSSGQTSGTYTLVLTDIVPMVTASGGSVGPFQYIVLYNDGTTVKTDPLIGAWDYGSEVTLLSGETFDVDFTSDTITLGP